MLRNTVRRAPMFPLAGTGTPRWLGSVVVVSLLLAAPLLAGDEPGERTPPGKWVLGSSFGAGSAGGGYGEFLETPINLDLNIAYQPGEGAWRLGAGLQFGAMDMKPPYDDEKEWARLDTYLFATRVFNRRGKLRPYLQGRVGLARIHPRSELFYFEEPEDLEPGASPTKSANGISFTLQPGLEIQLEPSLSLDLSAWWTGYRTGDYSLTPPMHGPLDPPLSATESVSSGQEYGLRAGLVWRPHNPHSSPRSAVVAPRTRLDRRHVPDYDREQSPPASWQWPPRPGYPATSCLAS